MATTRIYANCGLAAAGAALALLGAPPAAAQTATPLANPSFEAPGVAVNGHNGQVTGSIANSWYDNSGYGDYTALYSLNSTNPHGGAACQNIALSAVRSGNLQMAQTVPLKGGSRYTISVWMRGTPGVLAAMTLQGPPPAYTPYADAWASLTGAWQQVSAQGYVPNDAQGAVYVSMNAPGSVCVDDVAVSYAPAPAPQPTPNVGAIPPTFFGMHVGTYTNNFFLNGAFDQPFVPVNGGSPAVTGVVAHNWFDNSLWASVNVAYQGDSVAPHGGGAAQKITVRSLTNGEAQLVQHVSVVAGKSYTFGAWLRGQPGVNANLKIINLNPPYTVYATTPALSLTGAWQYFSATGQVNDTGDALLVVGGASNGTFSIDDASFTDAGGTQLSGGVPWPQKPFGTLRLWDSNTAWAMLEPLKGRWNFQTLDTWVAAAKPGQDIILTLGQSPAWASSNPTKASVYGLGASAPPANIQDWTTYVTSVANRYKGRIRFYEIWNEPNDPDFYSGNIAQLVALTQAANAAIKAVDPGATVISAPAYSAGYLDAYLAAGAKNYVDVIGYHVYANPPEDTGRQLSNVRLAMAKNGVASKPLWDTEGASGDTTTPLTTATNYLLRKYLADLAFGAGRFDWYTWGQATYFCVGTEQANPTVLTGAGIAYGFLQQWLQGATLNKALIDAAGNWQVWITMSGGVKGLIVWNPTVSGTFQIPAGIAMNAVWTFDGRQVSATGASIAVSDAPIMLVGN